MEHSRLPRREGGREAEGVALCCLGWRQSSGTLPSRTRKPSVQAPPSPRWRPPDRRGVGPKHHPLTVPLTFGNPVPPLVLIARSWLLLSVY